MIRARLREVDVASRLGVDPKTVRRWLTGRVPYPANRAALPDLVGANETDLWPDADGLLDHRARPDELTAVYPHRWAIPRDVWRRLFDSAKQEIDILAYAALWLAEDAGLLAIIADKAAHGIRVRVLLGDPESNSVTQRGHEEGIGDAMPAKVRNAITLFGPLVSSPNVELRLHDTVLYNSIYCADEQLLINQHVYGLPASRAPVFSFRSQAGDSSACTPYLESFDSIRATSTMYR
jgi:hypothetical protein